VATEWEGNQPGRRRRKNLWTKDMTDVKTTELKTGVGNAKDRPRGYRQVKEPEFDLF